MTLKRKCDVVVVGARCAGAPLAMLLARAGVDVVLVDRATFPSSTLSTHLIWPPGVAALQRWGVLQDVLEQGPALCPVASSRVGGIDLVGPLDAVEGFDSMLSLRRTKLDRVLLATAQSAGAEFLEGVEVADVSKSANRVTGVTGVHLASREPVEIQSAITVGADGRASKVARCVSAPEYGTYPSLTGNYYAYFERLGLDRTKNSVVSEPPYEIVYFPTDEDLSVVNVVVANRELPSFKKNLRANFDAVAERCVPGFSGAVRRSRLYGTVQLPNYMRVPWGPGWLLVGDAAHHRDPIRAQGIHEAFLDAESAADRLVEGMGSDESLRDALAKHHEDRDRRVGFPYALCLNAAALREVTRTPHDWLELLASDATALRLWRGAIAGSVSEETLTGYYDAWRRKRLQTIGDL